MRKAINLILIITFALSSIFAVEVSGTGIGSGVLWKVVSKIPQDIFSRPTQLIAIKAQICNEA
mgnify:CR=1 FL=1